MWSTKEDNNLGVAFGDDFWNCVIRPSDFMESIWHFSLDSGGNMSECWSIIIHYNISSDNRYKSVDYK